MTEAAGQFLIVAGVLVAFYMAWNVGANDVANAMGTSVGSKALTLKQAVLVAAVFEFLGAFLLGGSVSDTVRKGIINPELFAANPEYLACGMLSALLAAAIWLNLASVFGLPVSTTHSIVGAVAGFGIMQFGLSAVDWHMMGRIVMSWFISPLSGALIAYGMFVLIRRLILDQMDPRAAVDQRMPILLFIVFSTIAFSLFVKGAKNVEWLKALHLSMPAKVAVSAVAGLILAKFGARWIRARSKRIKEEKPYAYVERVFIYLQIITACYVALAHGANDVANAVGPLAAVVHIVGSGTVDMSVAMPTWILLLGGVGIVMGLATFGYRVMATIGTKIIEMSPTRGFAAEFGAATTVLIYSLQGLPISTTHTLVGAVVGVGLARGMGALDKRVLGSIAASWFITVPVSAILSIIFYTLLKLFI